MRNLICVLILFVTFGYVYGQDIQYVKAENGLVIREKPNRGAARIGMLDYGTAIEITEHTNLKLDVIDNGEKCSGEWVKVRSIDAYDTFDEGYVFNGFLTQEKLRKRFNANYNAFSVSINDVSEKENKSDTINPDFDAVLIYSLNDDENLDNKIIRVKHHVEFRSIKVFQKHENSIAISDDNSHCDLIYWKHYYSSWRPLKPLKSNKTFETLQISAQEKNRFINIDLEELKNEVKETCGKSWGESIKNIKTLNDFPVFITVSKVYYKIEMIDIDGNKIEKIIIFEIPLNS